MNDFKTIYMYENLHIFAYFFKKQEDFSRLLKNSNIFKYLSMCQTRSWYFWIKNAMCMFVCFHCILFAPVILTIINRFVNNFPDIRWWLLKPRSLMSTLHHNKFTYLDYSVFLLSSYSRTKKKINHINQSFLKTFHSDECVKYETVVTDTTM